MGKDSITKDIQILLDKYPFHEIVRMLEELHCCKQQPKLHIFTVWEDTKLETLGKVLEGLSW